MLPKLGLLQATHGKCAGTSLTPLVERFEAGLRDEFGEPSNALPAGIEGDGGSERGAPDLRGRSERGTSSRRGATTSMSGWPCERARLRSASARRSAHIAAT